MPSNMNITFLGTSAGGGPTPSRRCSSLAVLVDNEIWLVDCAEGTQTQLAKAGLSPKRVTKIFLTHLHGESVTNRGSRDFGLRRTRGSSEPEPELDFWYFGTNGSMNYLLCWDGIVDHSMGIVPLICNIMYGLDTGAAKHVDVYGPPGLRLLLRTTFTIIEANLSGTFAVHELLQDGAKPSCSTTEGLHSNERPGRDVRCDERKQWRMFDIGAKGVELNAGPMVHRATCIGYVFSEAPQAEKISQETLDLLDKNGPALLASTPPIRHPRALLNTLLQTREPLTLPDGTTIHPPPLSIPGRKLVILGDTSNPEGVLGLAEDASVLVHESTNAYVDPGWKVITDEGERARIRNKAVSRGHSTACMAGEFARKIGAKRLYLNHLSAKYPDPVAVSSPDGKEVKERQARAIEAIEDQATTTWDSGSRAIAARDLMSIEIVSHELL